MTFLKANSGNNGELFATNKILGNITGLDASMDLQLKLVQLVQFHACTIFV